MSTIAAPQPTAPRAPALTPLPRAVTLMDIANALKPGQCLTVNGVTWDEYWRTVLWRDEYRTHSVRLTFDRGELSVMVITNQHERFKRVLDLMIVSWIVGTGGEYVPSGELTHHRDDLERGFEPDDCYYVQNWQKVTGTREIDFKKDPPPDLMIEIEVSRTVVSRLGTIAAFKIPEVWRYDGERITPLAFQPDGTYAEVTASTVLPGFPFAEAAAELTRAAALCAGYGELGRLFRAFAAKHSAPPAAPTAPNT
jgi:Uma2 family endonuclease